MKTSRPFYEIQPQYPDLRIVIVGQSGVGKSATGNTILGNNLFRVNVSSESETIQCETHQKMVEGRNISVTETPGLFGTSILKNNLKSEIHKCVQMSAPGPHVFLLVIRLDLRFTDEEMTTVKWIQENFGKDVLNYALILFTRGDQLDKPIDDFLIKNKKLMDLIAKCKGGYHVFNNKIKNLAQVTKLLERIDRLVQENRGEHYWYEMYQEAQRTITEQQEGKREGELRKIVERQRKSEADLRKTDDKRRKREEKLIKREEGHRQREVDLRMREDEQRKREEELRKGEEEQRKREEELRKIFEELRKGKEGQRKREEELRNIIEELRKRDEGQRKREGELRKREEGQRKREEELRKREEGQRKREGELRKIFAELSKRDTGIIKTVAVWTIVAVTILLSANPVLIIPAVMIAIIVYFIPQVC